MVFTALEDEGRHRPGLAIAQPLGGPCSLQNGADSVLLPGVAAGIISCQGGNVVEFAEANTFKEVLSLWRLCVIVVITAKSVTNLPVDLVPREQVMGNLVTPFLWRAM